MWQSHGESNSRFRDWKSRVLTWLDDGTIMTGLRTATDCTSRTPFFFVHEQRKHLASSGQPYPNGDITPLFWCPVADSNCWPRNYGDSLWYCPTRYFLAIKVSCSTCWANRTFGVWDRTWTCNTPFRVRRISNPLAYQLAYPNMWSWHPDLNWDGLLRGIFGEICKCCPCL